VAFKGIYILECWGENNRGKTLKHCPICESYDLMPMTTCDQCGYDDKSSEISDKDKLFSFLSKIKKSKNWAEEVRIKKRVNDIQINKHGRSSTNPNLGGWSKRKTAILLKETIGSISTDTNLAEALDDYPNLLLCRNKNEAKKRLVEIKSGGQINTSGAAFTFEKDLQDYLKKNWDKTPFSNEWILEKAGLFSRGKYNTGEIGELDFLARHVSEPKWLVIELKRDQTSDETVGQILRYMGWVKENLAAPNEEVEGLIISASADEHIRYALLCIPNVNLKIYRFHNEKIEFKAPEFAYLNAKLKKFTPEQKAELLRELQNDLTEQ